MEGVADGMMIGLANMPTWVWYFIVITIIILMKPWENIDGIPTWVWGLFAVLAVWALITGK